ncbi:MULTISPECIES: hypothetical protein [Acinetobacter]|uniref:hypothetical protein n=1 Tax=Acinetobacter TaxID=469 RepID=UPI0015D3F729|nr:MULTISPECIES: hypothetical protein [Acinetobacter]MCL6232808.1 hypothetical protein [Acinetobacter amyesii]
MIKIFIQEFLLKNTDFSSFLEKFLQKNSKISSDSESLTNLSFDDNFLKGTYYKKILQKESTNNPFVAENYIEFEYFVNQQFYLIQNESRYFLVIINPTKYTKNFFSYLDELSGLNLILKDKHINIESMIEKNLTNISYRIIRAKFSAVTLSETSKATIEISSTTNAINDFINTFGNIYHIISKAKIILSTQKHTDLDLDISKTGLIQISKLSSLNENDILHIINIIY